MANRFIQHIEKSIKQNWESLAMTNFKTKQSYSYMDIARDITKLHILFEELNIHQEDSIALIGDNSPEWAIVYLATITYGAIIVPIPHNYKSDDVASIIENSKTKLLFIDNECWSRLENKYVRGLRATFALEDYRCLWQTQGEILHLIMKRLPSIFHEKYPDGFNRDVIKYDEKDDNDICCSLFAFAEREVLGNEMFMRGKDYIMLIKKFEYERHETSKANCLGGFSLADMYSSFFSIILPFVTGVHVTYIQTSSV